MRKFSPEKELASYAEPLLILHGSEDDTVPYQDSKYFVDSTPNRDILFESIEGNDHGFHTEPNETVVTNLLVDFFK